MMSRTSKVMILLGIMILWYSLDFSSYIIRKAGVSSYSACLKASNWENYCRNEWIAYKNIVSHQSFIDFWLVLKKIVTIINTDLESRSILIYFFFIIWWPLNFTAVGLLKTIVDWNKRYCHHLLAIPLFLCQRRRIKAFLRKTSFSLIIRERNQIARLRKKKLAFLRLSTLFTS